MLSKINHIAIVSENYSLLAKFYEAVFGMKYYAEGRAARAVTVGDGYLGLNINPRKSGRRDGLDHFGIEVEDIDTVLDRMKKFPKAEWLKRPSSRPFATLSANDPDGNVFDISQKEMSNRGAIYVENDGNANPRRVHHVAVRTKNPEECAAFYSEVFELSEANRPAGDPNHYLTDGRVTLIVMPWRIKDYEATSVVTPGMSYIGFEVEDVETVKQEVEEISANNPRLAPYPLFTGKEGIAMGQLFERSNPYGQHFMTDPDGVLIDIFSA